MNTFETIIYKILNIQNNIFSPNYDKSDNIGGIHKIMFGSYIDNKIYKNKFDFLNETINNFYFIKKDKERNEFIDYFNKIQKTYHTLNRFSFLYKIRKATVIVNTDLQLNEINLDQKNVISIYDNNHNYLFKIQDLLKIIYISLTNTYMFFCEPITIKNPYNNLPFEKSIFYYIYFYVINNTYIGYIKHDHIDIFFKFKQCNFNMTKFVDSYEYILRENSIKNYITNSTKIQIKNDILKMIREYNICYNNYKIIVDNDFPADGLIRIMKPYLHLYLTAYYSLVPKNKTDAKYKLIKKLKEFQKFNPSFGRKIIVLKNKIKNGKIMNYKSHTNFNFEHKKFNTFNSENFMNNHLTYQYNDNNIYHDNEVFINNSYENNTSSNHHTITNFNLFRVFVVENTRHLSQQEDYGDDEDDEDITQDNEENSENTNLESETNSELVQDYYDEIPDEDSIS
jgi:hypothetical protein